jgi:predicted nuclease of predicted toxin-antitoxin system
MRFLADMGVSERVVEWLRTNGHDAVHLRDEGCNACRTAKSSKRQAGNSGSF